MTKSLSMLDEDEWLGEFWAPDDKDDTYPGILSYSPADGISLSLQLAFGNETMEKSGMLNGYCQKLGLVTLFGCFVKTNGESNCTTKLPVIFASLLICGTDTEYVEEGFDRCAFELSNFREFVHPQGYKLDDKYSKDAISIAEIEGAKISLKKSVTGTYLAPREISKVIWVNPENDRFMDDIDSASSKVAKKHGIDVLYLKKDIGTEIVIESDKKELISYYNLMICSITDLFSKLIVKESVPVWISLFRNDGEKESSYKVLQSILTSPRDIQADKNHHFLTVNYFDIKDNFNNLISTWNAMYSDSSDFILNVLREHIRGRTNSLQHAVLLISALEQWFNKYENDTVGEKKYDFIMCKYSTDDLNQFLIEKSPVSKKDNESIGQLISSIRSTILHPQRGGELDLCAFANISEVIFVVLLRAVFIKLGVSQSAIDKIGVGDVPVFNVQGKIDI